MDVSDGLLIDAARLARASAVAVTLSLDAIPLSEGYLTTLGDARAARLRAATAGDDYELLFSAPDTARHRLVASGETLGLPLTRIGRCDAGDGLFLTDAGGPVPLPDSLGWEHDRS